MHILFTKNMYTYRYKLTYTNYIDILLILITIFNLYYLSKNSVGNIQYKSIKTHTHISDDQTLTHTLTLTYTHCTMHIFTSLLMSSYYA